MRLLRLGLLLAGAALFVWLVVSIGPGAVMQAFRDLSWCLLVILVFPFGMTTLLDTLGWRYALVRYCFRFNYILSSRIVVLGLVICGGCSLSLMFLFSLWVMVV